MKFDMSETLPIMNSMDHTLMLKFKCSGDVNASDKTLFQVDTGGVVRYRIALNTADDIISFIFGTSARTIPAAAPFSTTDWNVVVVKADSTTNPESFKMFLKVPGQNVQSTSSGSSGSSITSNTYVYIGTNPDGDDRCDCTIGEIAIWKYPISDSAASEVCSRAMPIKENTNFELNRRLTYYQDWNYMSGNAISNLMNPYTWLQFDLDETVLGSDGDMAFLDVDRRRMIKVAQDGTTTNILSKLESWDRLDMWPIVEKYNHWRIYGYVGAFEGETNFTISYNAKRRM
jgi:hypothetical protein